MRKLSFLLLLFSGLLFTIITNAQISEASKYLYKNVKIGGGGFVTGIIFSEAASNIFYARTDMGGAYRWDNVNGTWVQMLNFLGHNDFQLSNVESIATDPSDSSRVYLACGQDIWSGAPRAIFRSSDKGVTLEKIIPPFEMGGNYPGRGNGERLQVDPNKNNILFFGSRTRGLYRSIDLGSNWTTVGNLGITTTPNNGGINIVLFDKNSSTPGNATQTIYIGVSRTGTNIYRSTDGGSTFSALAGQPNSATLMPHRMKMGPDSVLYITFSSNEGPNGETSGAVWKYKTTNSVWTNITPAGVTNVGFGGICPDKLKSNTVMVTTIGWFPDKIYRSTNGGSTWKEVSIATTTGIIRRNTSESPWIAWHRTVGEAGHWLDDIEIDPFNSSRVMYIEGGGAWTCNNITDIDQNNTVTWNFFCSGLEQMGGWGTGKNIISPPSGACLFTVLSDIGGFKHHNLDVSPPDSNFFNPIGNSNTSIDIAWLNPKIIARLNYGTNSGNYSTNGGTTWSTFATNPTIPQGDPGYIAVSANGTYFVWNPQGAPLYYSSNKGSSWIASTGGPVVLEGWNRYIPVADKVNDSKFYTHDAHNGKVYRSINGGATWVNVGTAPTPSDPGGWAMQSVPGYEGHLWLPEGTIGLSRSADGGTTWTKISQVQACEQVGFGKAAPLHSYPAIYIYAMINTNWGFYRSDDIGDNWVRINDDQHSLGWISGICGDPRIYSRFYISTTGRGVFYANSIYDCHNVLYGNAFIDSCGTCVDTTKGDKICATSIGVYMAKSFSFTPNPFSQSLQLHLLIPSEYMIVNMSCEVVESGHCQSDCLVGSNLSAGFYLLTVRNPKELKTVKIIKQ